MHTQSALCTYLVPMCVYACMVCMYVVICMAVCICDLYVKYINMLTCAIDRTNADIIHGIHPTPK